jgi:hypothetical protein
MFEPLVALGAPLALLEWTVTLTNFLGVVFFIGSPLSWMHYTRDSQQQCHGFVNFGLI